MNFKVSSGGIGNINTYKGVNNNTLRREFINQEYEQDDPNIYNNTADNTEIQYTQTSSYNDNINETEVDYNVLHEQYLAMAEYYGESINELEEYGNSKEYLSYIDKLNNMKFKFYDFYFGTNGGVWEDSLFFEICLKSWYENYGEEWQEIFGESLLEQYNDDPTGLKDYVDTIWETKYNENSTNILYLKELQNQALMQAFSYDYYSHLDDFEENKEFKNPVASYEPTNLYIWQDAEGNPIDPSKLSDYEIIFNHEANEVLSDLASDEKEHTYYFMTKEERQVAVYLYNTGNTEMLTQYFEVMKEEANKRDGILQASDIIDQMEEIRNKVGTTVTGPEGRQGEYTKIKACTDICALLFKEGLLDGIANYFCGIENLFNADGIISPEQYKSIWILGYIINIYGEDTLRGGIFSGAYNISSSIGNMVPSIALSTLTTVILGPASIGGYLTTSTGLVTVSGVASTTAALSMGFSAAGNARESGLQNGMTQRQAWTYGILTGLSETCLEKLLGGIPGIGALDRGFFGNILSEGIEEFSQTILDAMFITLITGEPIEIDMEEAIKSGIYGMISAGILNGGQLVLNTFSCNISTLTEEQRKAIIKRFEGMDMTTPENQTLLKNVLAKYDINVSSSGTNDTNTDANIELTSEDGLTTEEISMDTDTNTELSDGDKIEFFEVNDTNIDIKTETPSRDIIELSKIKDPLIIEDGINNGTITKSQIHNLFNNLVSNTFGSLNLSDDVATRLYIDLLQVAKNTGLEISTVQETGSLLHSMIDVTTLFSKLDGNNFVLEQLPTGAKKIEILDKQLKDGINSLLKNVTSKYNLDINLDMICDIVVKMNPSLIEDISTNKQALINNFQSFLFNFTSIDTQSLKDASHITDVAVNLGFKLDDISLISIDGNIDGNKVNALAGKMDNFKTRVIYKYNEYLITKNIYKMLSHGKSIYEVTAYASTARNSVRVISQTIMADYIDPKLKQGTNGWNVNYKTSFLNKLFKSSPDLQIKFVEYMNNHGICTGSQEFADISYEVKQSLRSDPKMLTAVENFYSTIIGSDGTSIDTNVVSNEAVENAWLNVLDGSVKANDNVDSILGLDKFQNQNVFEKAKTIYDFLKISDLSEVKDFVNNGKISKNLIKDILTDLFGSQLGKWEISDDDAYNLYLDLLDNCNKAGKKITDIANLIGNKFENITNVKEFEFFCKEILGYDASTIDDYYKVLEGNAKWDAEKIYDGKDYQKIVTLILDGKINLDDIGIPMELEDFEALSKTKQLDKVAALYETKVKDTIIKEDLIVKRKAAAQTALQIKVNAFSGDDVYESSYISNKILSLIVDARKEKYSIKYKKIVINGIDYTKYFPKCDELQSNKRVKKYTMELLKLTSAELQEFAKINGIEYKVENEFEILAQYLKDNYGKIKIDGLIFQNAKSGESNFVKFGGNVGDTSQIVTYTLDGINYLTEKLTPVYAYYDKAGNKTQNPSEAKTKELVCYTKGSGENKVTISLADIKEIHYDYNISGGAYMLLESPKDLAAEYSKLCTYDASTNKFTILNMQKFGNDVLGGVPLDNVNGTYMLTCSIPFNSDNISIPSINNGCMYPAYGVPGGYILGSGKQETVISGTSGGQAIIDAISKNGIGTITSYDGKVIHIELIK